MSVKHAGTYASSERKRTVLCSKVVSPVHQVVHFRSIEHFEAHPLPTASGMYPAPTARGSHVTCISEFLTRLMTPATP